MQFGTWLDRDGYFIDSTHFPPVAAKYPFRGRGVYELFPYSGPKYDSDKALIEIKESTNNLNTRLSNLKKINKSLIRFQENSSSLNWEELQKISVELEDDYKDN